MADVIVNVTGNALTVSSGKVSGVRDYQVFRETVFTPSDVNVTVTGNALALSTGSVSGVRDYQVFREAVIDPITLVSVTGNALAISSGIVRGVRDYQIFREAVITPPTNVSVAVTGNSIAVSLGTPTLALGVGVSVTGQLLSIVVGKLPTPPVDRPSIQFHPVLKPLDFMARPLTQPGRRAQSFATFLTTPGASRSFSMPLGARNQPIRGKPILFTMGGFLSSGSAGTLVITPFYGADAKGVNLGSSRPQSYPAHVTATAWRLHGQIIFQDVTLEPGLAQVICGGSFVINTHPATVILFGSASPVFVDASATKPIASGALNFAATFAPFALNANALAITTRYAFLKTF